MAAVTSPVENVADVDPVRFVKVTPLGRSTVKFVEEVPPTGKAWVNVELPELLNTVRVAFTSKSGVLVSSLIPGHKMVPVIELVAEV